MHILYLHQYFCPPGGSGNNRSLELARQWVRAGHQVTFLTSPAYFPAEQRRDAPSWTLRVDGMDVHVLNVEYAHRMPFRARMRAWLRFYRKARRYARQLQGIDLIYASSAPLTIGELGRRLARRWRIPYVFETVDVWPDVPIGMGIVRARWQQWLLHRLTNRIYRQSAAVVALSEGMRDQILSHGVPPEKVHVVHNGTDPRAFAYVARTERPGLRLIYTGTVGIANGVDAIVRLAHALAIQGREDIEISILGDGNAMEGVRKLAKDLEVRNLRFLAPVPKEEVAGLLAAADAGLVTFAPFPVLEANSANKFYDYLATGLPVLLNYEGWQAQYIDEHTCGFTARMGDEQAFLEAVLRMADLPHAARLEMGKRGRALVEQQFDRRELADRILGIFREVLTSR